MRTITQRELRNESGEIMRQVQDGASFRVTTRGTPIAVLSPITADSADDLTLRKGTGVMDFPPAPIVVERTDDVLRELRGDR